MIMTKMIPYESEHALHKLGQRLVAARQRHHWRQSDVAERTGLSRGTIQKMESGEPGVAMGNYMMLLALYGAASDLDAVCTETSALTPRETDSTRQRVRNTHELDNDF